MAVRAKKMIPSASIFRLIYLSMMSHFLSWPAGRAGTPALRASAVPRFLRAGSSPLASLSLVMMVPFFGGGKSAYVGQPLWFAQSSRRSGAPTSHVGYDHLGCFGSNLEACDWSVVTMTPARARPTVCMAVVGEDDHHLQHHTEKGENIELAAEVVGVVTKAAVGVAVNRAVATVSEEQGFQRPLDRPASSGGAKRRTLARLLSYLVTLLRSSGRKSGGKTWDVSGNARAPLRDGLATPTASSSSTASKKNNENDVEGVMVKGYWFPSLAAAAKAPAGRGIDLSKATVEAAGSAARTEPRQRREDRETESRWQAKTPRGVDFSCGAVLLSAPTPCDDLEVSNGDVAAEAGKKPKTLPSWRRLAVTFSERTGLLSRIQRTIRDSIPRMPREALLLIVSVAGGELAKREIAAQVEALEEPVRGPAWALLNETYRNVEAMGSELVQSNWDFASLITRELADWKRRGVGNSYQEALLKEVIELQTRAVLRPITSPAEEGNLMVHLNATYKTIEESIGRLLPRQTKEQLSLLEGLLRKLDEKGIGELSFDEVYRALLLGAVPPTLVTDAVRLLAAGRPGEGGGAGFLSMEASSFFGRESGGDVTLASLAARLNDSQAVTRAMTYTALAAETEVIESLREVLDGLQTSIRKSLLDMESDLIQQSVPPTRPNAFHGAASYINHAARSAVTIAIDGVNVAYKAFDASFEALAEPSRRTLLKSSELFPWHTWFEAWNNMTNRKENLFDTVNPPPFHSVEVARQHHCSEIDVSIQGTVGNEPRTENASRAGRHRSAGLINSDDLFLEEGGGRSGSPSDGGCTGKSLRGRTYEESESHSAASLGGVRDPGDGVTHAGVDICRYRDTKGSPALSGRRVKKRWRPGDERKGHIGRAEGFGRRRWRG